MCMYIPISDTVSPDGFTVFPHVPLSPLFAEDDIPCYKYVILKEGNLISPYRGFSYTIGELYTNEKDFSKIASRGNFYYIIEGGGFHSFVYFLDCHEEYNLCEKDSSLVIVKCHIPKGTYYYMGEDVHGIPNYVSQSIVIDEIINDD